MLVWVSITSWPGTTLAVPARLQHASTAEGLPGGDRGLAAPGLAGMLAVVEPARVQLCGPQILPCEAVQMALHPCSRKPSALVCLACRHVKQCQD